MFRLLTTWGIKWNVEQLLLSFDLIRMKLEKNVKVTESKPSHGYTHLAKEPAFLVRNQTLKIFYDVGDDDFFLVFRHDCGSRWCLMNKNDVLSPRTAALIKVFLTFHADTRHRFSPVVPSDTALFQIQLCACSECAAPNGLGDLNSNHLHQSDRRIFASRDLLQIARANCHLFEVMSVGLFFLFSSTLFVLN